MKFESKNQIILPLLLVFFFAAVVVFNIHIHTEQQFSFLAKSFLKLKPYFTEIPQTLEDTAPFANKHYWPLGPLPSIVLLPFVFIFQLFKAFFYQGYMQIALVVGVYYLTYKISGQFSFSKEDSLYLAFAFCFASTFLGVAMMPWSWYFSQVLATFLLFLFLFEFFAGKRPLILGSIAGALLLTRITASLVFLVYIFDLLYDKKTGNKLKNAAHLMTPYFLALVLLSAYNYIRFQSPFEQGYAFQIIPDFAKEARDLGILSLAHLPSNLYYFLLAGPLPVFRDGASHILKFPFISANQWGMSLFVTSPYFVFLLFQKFRDKLAINLIAVSALIFIPISLYYGIGYRQFGYRYSLDFLPLLFVVFVKKYFEAKQKLSFNLKLIIIFSALANLYLFLTIWGILPS